MYRLYDDIATLLEKRFNFDVRYFMRGGFWLTLGQVVITALGVITTALFAHYLSESDYGVYRYLIGLAVIFSSFSLTGIGQSIIQTAAKKYYNFYQETIKISFLYSTGIFLLGVGGFGYYLYNQNVTLALGCLLIAFLQPITNTYQYTPTYLQGLGRFKDSTILHTIKSISVSVLTVAALFFTQNVILLFAAYLFAQALTSAVSHWWYRPRRDETTPHEVFTTYLSYAKHTSVRFLILNASFRADSIIIFTQLGAVELAIYSIATVIPEQIKNSFKSISTLLLPKYAKHSDFTAIKKSIPVRSFQLVTILTVISIAYILLIPFVYSLIFPKYESAVLLSQILALSFPAMVSLIPMSALESQLKDRALYTLNTISSAVMLITTVLGIIFYGLLGAIIAKVLYRYIVMIVSYVILYRK